LELLELKANVRTTVGKCPARALRREGRIPAILYGPKAEPAMLSLNTRELEQLLRKGKVGQSLVNLLIANGENSDSRTVMIKELDMHPVSRSFIHADLYEVAMDRKIRVRVPVTTKGTPAGIEMGGLLQIIRRELEVLCFPNEIPEKIELDVTELNIGDAIHVREIPTEGDVEIPAEVDFTVVTILSPKGGTDEEEGEEGEEEETEEADADA